MTVQSSAELSKPARWRAVSSGNRPGLQTETIRADAGRLYEAMHGGLSYWGANPRSILAILEGYSAEMGRELRAQYRSSYGRDLERDLKAELGLPAHERAVALLAGAHGLAGALALRDGLAGRRPDRQFVFGVLGARSPEQREEYKRAYRGLVGHELEHALGTVFEGDDRTRALALLEGNQARAEAAAVKQALARGDQETLYQVLARRRNGQQRTALINEFKALAGRALRFKLVAGLQGSQLDRALGLLDGNHGLAEAARIRQACEGWGVNKSEIFGALGGKTAEQRRAISKAYLEKYKTPLAEALRLTLTGNDLEKAHRLLEDGEVSAAAKLKYALEGWGADSQAVLDALAGSSPAELLALRQEYRDETGRELEADLARGFSGRERFAIQLALKGRADSRPRPDRDLHGRQRLEMLLGYTQRSAPMAVEATWEPVARPVLNLDSPDELTKVIDFRELLVEAQKPSGSRRTPPKPNPCWQNQAQARLEFEHYLDGQNFHEPAPFADMLRASHRLAVEGRSGQNRYFRDRYGDLLEADRLPAGTFHRGLGGGVYPAENAQVEKLARRYRDPYRAVSRELQSVHLVGILDKRHLPYNIDLAPGAQKHVFPPPSAFEAYFTQMRLRLEKLAGLPARSTREKLRTIAEFYQYGANARPFHQLNHALFLNLSNCLLKRHGFSPVYGGRLAQAALRLQPEAFARYFEDWANGPGRIY